MKTYILVFLVFISACQKNSNRTQPVVSESISAKTLFLEYVQGERPRLESIINDSIHCSVVWDTGLSGEVIVVSDSLIGLYGDSAWVCVGETGKKLKVVYHPNRELFNTFGIKTGVIGKDFFKGKIIEMSFSENYFMELKDINEIGNDFTKIKIIEGSHLNIPIKVYIQGKTINAFCFIDTGTPTSLILNYRFAEDNKVSLEGAEYQEAQTVTKKAPIYRGITMDSIRLHDTYTAKGDYKISFMKYPNEAAMIGMLGNAFLDNFIFILDQKNYDLYLKPINK